MTLETGAVDESNDSPDESLQAAVVQVVNHMQHLEALLHVWLLTAVGGVTGTPAKPDVRSANPWADSPEGMLTRGTA